MIFKSKKAIGLAIATILSIIIAIPVGATPIGHQDPYGDGSILLDVSAVPVGDNWLFNYNVQNPGANVFFMSVGNVNPETKEAYEVVEFELPDAAHPTLSRLTSNSLLLYFTPYPGLLAGTNTEFSITYGSFIDAQSISFRTGGSGEAGGGDVNYTPEPGTLLLLGSGIIGLGFWRRKRKKL